MADSAGGTPYTSLTAFSPEDNRAMKASSTVLGTQTNASSPQDPFVSSGSHATVKLSAEASAFQPSFDMRSPIIPALPNSIDSSEKKHAARAFDHIEKLGGSDSTPYGPDHVNLTHFGTFTTDSNTSRILKVTGNAAVSTFVSSVEDTKRVRQPSSLVFSQALNNHTNVYYRSFEHTVWLREA